MSGIILAVVGSSEEAWRPFEEDFVRGIICGVIKIYDPAVIISGECPKGGIDIWVKNAAEVFGYEFKGYPPTKNSWYYYKKRNILIAEYCTDLVAIRSRFSTTYGSGWTADYAEKIGKNVKRIIL